MERLSESEHDFRLDLLASEIMRVCEIRDRLRNDARAAGDMGSVRLQLYKMDQAMDRGRTAKELDVAAQE
jgi:hypothetical protein